MLSNRSLPRLSRLYQATCTNRALSVSPRLRLGFLKWERNPKGPNVPVGPHTGHPEDPIYHTRDMIYRGTPSKGDKLRPDWGYRMGNPNDMLYLDRCMTYFLTAMIWFWGSYHLYWHYEHLIGHYYMPFLNEFTDEELGIPPDDAPDPEYWGNHGREYGTYR